MVKSITTTAIQALEADRDALVGIASGLSQDKWEAPSGCEGWTTKDLVSHLAALFRTLTDGGSPVDTSGLDVEEIGARLVEARRSMTPAEVLADYEAVSVKAIELLPSVAALETDIPFSQFESHPAALVPLAFCFDHYTHIRADLFAPRGSLTGQPPPSDELRLAPTLAWVEEAIPTQNPALVGSLPGRVDLVVTGPAARTIPVGQGESVASIRSDGPSLVGWITQRTTWDELDVSAEGDPAALDAAGRLKVY